jgi:hypothetical protein
MRLSKGEWSKPSCYELDGIELEIRLIRTRLTKKIIHRTIAITVEIAQTRKGYKPHIQLGRRMVLAVNGTAK